MNVMIVVAGVIPKQYVLSNICYS